jgi:hypothetical protein
MGAIRPGSRTHVLGRVIVRTVGSFVQAVGRTLMPVMNDSDLPAISCFHWDGKMESNLGVKYERAVLTILVLLGRNSAGQALT